MSETKRKRKEKDLREEELDSQVRIRKKTPRPSWTSIGQKRRRQQLPVRESEGTPSVSTSNPVVHGLAPSPTECLDEEDERLPVNDTAEEEPLESPGGIKTRFLSDRRGVGFVPPPRRVKKQKTDPAPIVDSDMEIETDGEEDEMYHNGGGSSMKTSSAGTEEEYYTERITAFENQVKEDSCLYICPCCGEEKQKRHFKSKPFIELQQVSTPSCISYSFPDGTPLLQYIQLATDSTHRFGNSELAIKPTYQKKLQIYLRSEFAINPRKQYALCDYWFVHHLPVSLEQIQICTH